MTTSPTQRRPLAARLALVSTVSLGLLAGPVAFAGPASAAPSHGDKDKVNCWIVKVHDPYLLKIHKEGYKKFAKVDFSFKIKCDKNAKVKYDHWIVKEKGKKHEVIKHKWGKIDAHKNRVEHENTRANVDKDKNDRVKVFHVVKITFEKDKGKHGYDVEKSKPLTIRFGY
jgi:hypothetical protein